MTEPSSLCSSGNLSKSNITDGMSCEGEEYDEGAVTEASSISASKYSADLIAHS